MHAKLCAAVLAALSLEGALAMPSMHRHAHKRAAVAGNDDWVKTHDWTAASNYKGVDWATVDYNKPSGSGPTVDAASVPAANSSTSDSSTSDDVVVKPAAPQAVKAGKPSSSGSPPSSSNDEAAGPDNNGAGPGFGGISSPIGSSDSDTYIGNVGVPFGSAVQLVDSTSGFKYTNTFINNGGSDRKMIIWLASSPSQPTTPNTGMFGGAVKTFNLPAGGQQVVAFDGNTQPVACDWSAGQLGSGGIYQCVWIEMNMGTIHGSGTWSSADVSKIQSGDCACDVSVTGAGQTSSCSEASYDASNAAEGGVGINGGPGEDMHLTTTYS